MCNYHYHQHRLNNYHCLYRDFYNHQDKQYCIVVHMLQNIAIEFCC